MSNGLAATDIGKKSAVSGFPAKFLQLVASHYAVPSATRFEPHVAEKLFRQLLDNANVTVRFKANLVSVAKTGNEITCLTTEVGTDCANHFVDSSYAGDLIAKSSAPFKLGMEDLLDYGETLAQERKFVEFVETSDSTSAIPYIGSTRGKITDGMPSLTYRPCITEVSSNKVPFKTSSNYEKYAPAWRSMVVGILKFATEWKPRISRLGTRNSIFYQIAETQADKFDLNSGWSSFMNVPTNRAYFDDLAARKAFNEQFADYMMNWLHFLQTEEVVPQEMRTPFANFGLCADEFKETDNWPAEPYLREGRRLVGQYTITQNDLMTSRENTASIALGSYPIDSKLTQLWHAGNFITRDIGEHLSLAVYEISYAAMLPKTGPENLLATIGISASPVAYGSLRIEVQYMAIGEAAGIAAAVSNETGAPFAAVNIKTIQERLHQRGVVFKAVDLCRRLADIFKASIGFKRNCKPIK